MMTPGSGSDSGSQLRAACPHCGAVFLLNNEHLNAREGLVRCGACREIFNAKWHLVAAETDGVTSDGPVMGEHDAGDESDSPERGFLSGRRGEPVLVAGEAEADADAEASADAKADLSDVNENPRRHRRAPQPGQPANRSEPEFEGNTFEGDSFEDDDGNPDPQETSPSAVDDAESIPPLSFPRKRKSSDDGHWDDDSESEADDEPLRVAALKPAPGTERGTAGMTDSNHSDPEPNPNNNPPPHSGRINMSGVDGYINPRSNPLNILLWSIVMLGFLLLLGWQIRYFFVEKYAQHEAYRPYLAGFCEIAACQLPPRHDPFRFTLTHTKIDLHPFEPGALRVTVKLVNEATFAQAYPDLQLTLTDRDGRVVGRRTFSPRHYLEQGRPNRLGSGELDAVRFDLARPHEKAVGFEVHIVPGPAAS